MWNLYEEGAGTATEGIGGLADAAQPQAQEPSPWALPMVRQLLDLLDQGLVVAEADGQVVHANRAARRGLSGDGPLQQLGGRLRVQRACDVAALGEALLLACRQGQRRMLLLGEPSQRQAVSVLPLGEALACRGSGLALVVLGRRKVCEELPLQAYARQLGLTPTETDVLRGLGQGRAPVDIAREHGVALSTVRTQVAGVRSKTGARNINGLVCALATLPPMASVVG